MSGINDYERSIRSQNGEDGILEEIFRRIGTVNRFFVEFGVGDGQQCNTAHLAARGWRGAMIEANPGLFDALKSRFPELKLAHEVVSRENIVRTFAELEVPMEFDLLSVDIDGNDYWMWDSLGRHYIPRVVVIEYNASLRPSEKKVMKYNPTHAWDGTNYFGASLGALAALGGRLGYKLIGTDSRGINAFFIRRELAGFPELTPEQAYHRPSYGPHDGGHPPGCGEYVDPGGEI